MATVSLIDPYSQQSEEIARRQRMAQALQERGSQVLEMPTMPGVSISPYAGLAKVLQSALGAYDEKSASDDYKKLQTDYRNAYNTQFGDLAKAISAPAVLPVEGQEAIPGQDEIPAQPAVMAPKIERGFGGYGQPQEAGQYEVSPAVAGQAAVAGQPAIAAKAGVPAGYISPETLKGIDIPEVKQLAMARYLAQFEPKQVKLGKDESLYNQVGFGPLTPLVTASIKADKLTPHWVEGQKDVNGTKKFGWYDLNSADKDASFKAGANPPAGEKSNWKEVTRDGQIYYEDFTISDAAKRQTTAIAKEAVKTTPHYSEIEDKGNVVIVDLSLPADQRLANAQIKGPIRNNLEKITTTDASGREISRYVDKATLATLGDIPAPYKGFMSDLAEAGQLPGNWQSIPEIAGLVRENLINKAGGITPKDLASLKVRIAEAASRLAYEGVPGFSAAGLTPQLPNYTTLGGGASSNSATPKITNAAEIADTAKRTGKSIEQVTRDAIAKGYRVE